MDEVKHGWPQRNPDVTVNDAGQFVGKNFTETDDLTSEEILEAWIYLDDFCHFYCTPWTRDEGSAQIETGLRNMPAGCFI